MQLKKTKSVSVKMATMPRLQLRQLKRILLNQNESLRRMTA